jgi:Cation efflux system protein CusB domain 1
MTYPQHPTRSLAQLIQAPTGSITGALLVPQAAVNQQQGGCQVTVIGADNRAQLRTVQVGPRVGTLWVVTSGLKPGERVVAVGADKAKGGGLMNPYGASAKLLTPLDIKPVVGRGGGGDRPTPH